MKFIIITGPPAAGKMTVGKALAARCGFKLFHNHMSIELVRHFFDFGDFGFSDLDTRIRWAVFEIVSKSDLSGLIFTLVWAFNEPEDHQYVADITAIFEKEGAEVFYVELSCELEERLIRNRQPSRLEAKASKRNIARSEQVLLRQEKKYRFQSKEGEIDLKNYLKIDNTELSAEAVAKQVADYFGFSDESEC